MRAFATEELATRLGTWEEDLFRARCEQAVGQLTNAISLRFLRRKIARAKTILNEKNSDAGNQE